MARLPTRLTALTPARMHRFLYILYIHHGSNIDISQLHHLNIECKANLTLSQVEEESLASTLKAMELRQERPRDPQSGSGSHPPCVE
jgi:hypothetical protein